MAVGRLGAGPPGHTSSQPAKPEILTNTTPAGKAAFAAKAPRLGVAELPAAEGSALRFRNVFDQDRRGRRFRTECWPHPLGNEPRRCLFRYPQRYVRLRGWPFAVVQRSLGGDSCQARPQPVLRVAQIYQSVLLALVLEEKLRQIRAPLTGTCGPLHQFIGNSERAVQAPDFRAGASSAASWRILLGQTTLPVPGRIPHSGSRTWPTVPHGCHCRKTNACSFSTGPIKSLAGGPFP